MAVLHLYSALNLLWVLCNSACINFLQFCLWCLVRPFNKPLYRQLMGSVAQALWVDVTSTSFPPTKLSVTGELPSDTAKPVILIANHQVDADWWYIWQAARHQQAAGNIKIVLKDQLKYLPIIGWGMRLFQFLFLRRRIEEDEAHIKKYMGGLIADDFPFWLVLFPEGTTIHSEYVTKSQVFAAREGRPKFERLLLPRTTGMQIILDAVAETKPDIYDLTLAFPSYSGEVPTYDMGYGRKVDTEVPSMKSLLAGKQPAGRVAMHSRKFAYEDATTDLQGFLDARWKEKEERLNYFIEHQQFPGTENTVEMDLSVSGDVMSSVGAVFRLWLGITLSCMVLPVVMMLFFPLYFVWVVYCFVYSVYDRTTNFWWPYIFNLFMERAAKTHDHFKRQQAKYL
ncbi:Acyl-CoA:lysophosphatidylglycerol acyltransferase 1 [Phytophthora pseudosyringae]|uniref:Acyl-CoA:lysophosphatidylglycerol acyltransferase 1 n=1 Tax=Phytophthora pseudosyringae TaxID=221518 RepID=A0A8T1W1L2_9STRA|nr:Acyl-CoA:lysophosphatidylglycerol acyltransferase 1 [Phytophthora pseudosyringae]